MFVFYNKFTKYISEFRSDDSGAVTVEFVLWVPVFMTILWLVADASLLFFSNTKMWRVASDTTRQVAVGALDTAEAEAFARNRSAQGKHYLVNVTSNGTIVTTNISIDIGDVSFTKLFAFAIGSKMSVTVVQRMEPIV